MKNSIQLFEKNKIRTVWNEQEEEWYFSIVDIVETLKKNTKHTKVKKRKLT